LNCFLLNILEITFESIVTVFGKLSIVGKSMSVINGISSVVTIGTTVGILTMAVFKEVWGTDTSLFLDVVKMGYSFEAVGLGKMFISSFSIS